MNNVTEAAASRNSFQTANDMVRSVSPSYIEWQNVDVCFGHSDLLVDYSAALVDSVLVELDSFQLNAQEVEEYLLTLLWIRVNYVNDRVSLVREYTRDVVVPAFWSQYLEQVGTVTLDDFGLKLSPQMDYEPLSAEVFNQRTIIMRKLSRTTISYAKQLPRDRRGSEKFMTLQRIDNNIVSHRNDVEPWTAFCGAFVATEQLAAVYTPLVNYGSIHSYSRAVSSVIS